MGNLRPALTLCLNWHGYTLLRDRIFIPKGEEDWDPVALILPIWVRPEGRVRADETRDEACRYLVGWEQNPFGSC